MAIFSCLRKLVAPFLILTSLSIASIHDQSIADASARAVQVREQVLETRLQDLSEVTRLLTEGLSQIEARIATFEFVRDWDYRISIWRPEHPDDILLTGQGDCRHKAALLAELYEQAGYQVRRVKVICDFADLPIPKDILQLRGVTTDVHDAIQLRLDSQWVYVDATWNSQLKQLGFPVTEQWDGRSPTRMVTEHAVTVITEFDERDLQALYKKHNVLWPERSRNRQFIRALNDWLDGKEK